MILEYRPGVPLPEGARLAEVAAAVRGAIESSAEAERRARHTLLGPHRDDLGILAVFDAASAFALSALKLRPGGSISPFCEPASVTSIPHSSWRRSIDPRPETESTKNRAGCLARSRACRMAGRRLVTPVDVSL